MGYRGARSRIPWCVSRASDMLEMSERESSDVRRTKPRAELRRRSLEAESRYTASNSGTLTGGPTVSSNSGTLTGGLTAFSRRPVLAEFRCVRGDARVAVQKTKRHVNQLLHSGAGDLTANNITPWQSIQRERQTLCSVYEWTDIFQPKGQW